ncbi:protein wech-like [Mercenaria mercenaria]|uniref:protein wech-like n=1 Tax=Mercenaria mercenaria TaxID=6596 RepID=UPI00234F5208|nr:protein wech-like [Mercenaria mercenaria]
MAGISQSDNDNLTKESDEVHEMFCEQCDEHGAYAVACVFCVDCQEYMCDVCMVYHKRYLPGHTQQDKYTMPQDFCLEKCDNHQEKVIKYFCQKCNKFACAKCKQEDHKSCNLGHIPSLIHGNVLDVSSEMISLMDKIDNMSKTLDETKEKINQNFSKVLSQEKDAKSRIKQGIVEKKKNFKRKMDEVINAFDKRMDEIIAKLKEERHEKVTWLAEQKKIFERKLSEGVETVEFEIGKFVVADQAKLNALQQDCKEVTHDLKSLRYDLELKRNIGQLGNIFVTFKKMQPDIIKCQEKMKFLIENNKTSDYEIDSEDVSLTLEPNILTHSVFTIGKVVDSTDDKVAIIPNMDLILQSEEKPKLVTFSSLCVLSENKLVVASYKHNCLFIINDLTKITPANAVNLSSNPWGIKKITADQVSVTFPDARSVKFLTISAETMNLNPKSLRMGGNCYGIACTGEHLVVSFLYPAEIRVINFDGIVINHLVRPSDGRISFRSPLCITLNVDHSALYISDSETNTVTCMTLEGKVKAIYKDDQLTSPLHMAIDGTGLVYVCGRTSNNIHQLSSDLKKGIVLLDRHELTSPTSVAYCTKRKRLYVGIKNENIVKVFKIKTVQDVETFEQI